MSSIKKITTQIVKKISKVVGKVKENAKKLATIIAVKFYTLKDTKKGK